MTRCLRAALLALLFAAIAWSNPARLFAQSVVPSSNVRYARISETELREWLTYLASDQLQGRQAFTEGYGLAAQYVASRLESWGVKPLGAGGSFLQPVLLTGYRATRNSSVRVGSGDGARTFKHGDHVTFPANVGGTRTLTFSAVEFLGYGRPEDFAGRDLKGKLVVTVPPPAQGPGAAPVGGRGAGSAGAVTLGAATAIAFAPTVTLSGADQALEQARAALAQATTAVEQAQQAARGRGGRGGGRGPQQPADVTTVQRIDRTVTPQFTGDETFFESLFAGGPLKFADVRERAQKGEPIAPVSWPAAITVSVDNSYEPISRQVTNNVVGLIEGSDPGLRKTYVLLGAHLDHVGYTTANTGRAGATDACRRRGTAAQAAVKAAGKVVQRASVPGGAAAPPAVPPAASPAAPQRPFAERDGVNNGADDNASGSAALLGIARAFATGPKPKRSVVFVWHTGEESGLYGSRYNADYPVVPIDAIQAHLNMDMVGRDDCDNIEGDFSNSVFVVGADRISTGLHNLVVAANRAMPTPLTLDYELNDATDPENVYFRSDHYSYAEKGIPIAFFTTGLHPDYHRVTDTVDKIRFPKLARIAQLVYQTSFSIANSEHRLDRDNKGPRTGFGSAAAPLR